MDPNQRTGVIITALPLERVAVMEHLHSVSETPPLNGSIYRRGIFDERSEPWTVIVAEIGAGNVGAAAETERILSHYSPHVAIFVGVAGAIKDLRHGDVVASTKIYGYESGKNGEKGFLPRPSVEMSAYALESRARFEAGEPAWRLRIKNVNPLPTFEAPEAKVGPIAAGEKIVASNQSQTYKFLRDQYGDAVAVEMEGHGFLLGVRMNHPTQGIVVRGISDSIGDKSEAGDKTWQPIAASHAAAFAFELLAKYDPHATTLKQATADALPVSYQLAHVGNVTGNHNTVTIYQQQQGILAEIDANTEIDAVCEKLKSGEHEVALHLLNQLKSRRWDRLTQRERYRVLANMGHALDQKGDSQQAARKFIEAKTYQPDDENARAQEAIAFHYLGDTAKAYTVAREILSEHPSCSSAAAVMIRAAPRDVALQELENALSFGLREDPDVMHALGWRALGTSDLAAAEQYARLGLKLEPKSPEFQDLLGSIFVQSEGHLKQSLRPVSIHRLQEAVEVLSASLAGQRGTRELARLRYTRAEAYDLLDRPEAAEGDFRASLNDAKVHSGFCRRFAMFLARNNRDGAAIEVLRQGSPGATDTVNDFMLANLLGERNHTGDREDGVRLLQACLPQLLGADFEVRSGIVATLVRLLSCLNRHGEAFATLDGIEVGVLTVATENAIRARALLQAGRKDDARISAINANASLNTTSDITERIRVAEMLGYVHEKQKALDLWKAVLSPDDDNPFMHRALGIAQELGDDQFILEFCKRRRLLGVQDEYTLELEVITLEKYGAYDEAINIMQLYLTHSLDEDYARVFRLRLSLLGNRLDRPELITTDGMSLPPVESASVNIGIAVARVLRDGQDPLKGVVYAYELLRLHFHNSLANQAFVAIVGIGDDDIVPQPTSIGPGCALKYRVDHSGEQKWLILEEGPEPDFNRNEIGLDHRWAKELEGKVPGEQFYLRHDPVQSRTATIEAFTSKYVYRKQEIFDTWEDRFPDEFFVRKYTSPTKEDGTPDISLILKALDQRDEWIQNLHDQYRNNFITVTTFARIIGTGILKSLSHIVTATLPVRCCHGNMEEAQRSDLALQGNPTFVIDPSALATLYYSNLYEHLSLLAGRCVICESSLDEFREIRDELKSPSNGFVGKYNGQYYFDKDNPQQRALQIQRLDNFLTKIQGLVISRTGVQLAAIDPETRKEMIDLFGQPTAEAIAEATLSGSVLWTDDMAIAVVSEVRCKTPNRVWTQHVFRHYAPTTVQSELSLFQLKSGYTFTRLEPEHVPTMCHAANWNPVDQPLREVIAWFSLPELIHDGAVAVFAASLVLVWEESANTDAKVIVTQAMTHAIFKRRGGVNAIRSVLQALQQLIPANRPNADRIRSELIQVLADFIRPNPETVRADWDRIIKKFKKRLQNHKDESMNKRIFQKKHYLQPTPKQRAERRKQDRKRLKKNLRDQNNISSSE